MKNNVENADSSPSRSLYENFNLSEMEKYESSVMLGDDLTSNNYLNNLNLYYNETEFINYENHDVDKYKKSYYRLLKVCIPQLRRGH